MIVDLGDDADTIEVFLRKSVPGMCDYLDIKSEQDNRTRQFGLAVSCERNCYL